MSKLMNRPERVYSCKDKYTIVAQLLQNQTGTVLDLGSRDQVLRRYLDPGTLSYFSADLGEGHDYCLNLEEPLPFTNDSFDIVIALDVLEHVEHIHQAFHELARIARRQVIVALPNFGSLPRRWTFFWRGNLGTQKYDLLPEYQGDRHRWLTIYPEINEFIRLGAVETNLTLRKTVEELEGDRITRFLARMAVSLALAGGKFTERCIYVMSKG